MPLGTVGTYSSYVPRRFWPIEARIERQGSHIRNLVDVLTRTFAGSLFRNLEETVPTQDPTFPTDLVVSDEEKPIDIDPGIPSFDIPIPGSQQHPALLTTTITTGHHQGDVALPLLRVTNHQQRSIFSAMGVFLVRDPGPDHLSWIRLRIGIGIVRPTESTAVGGNGHGTIPRPNPTP